MVLSRLKRSAPPQHLRALGDSNRRAEVAAQSAGQTRARTFFQHPPPILLDRQRIGHVAASRTGTAGEGSLRLRN